ncbi:hypothetical protein APP_03840 [Aeribacillus pallidus]|nr:hypothetical protein APP_03840 [Aeribacillus pallidus]
MLENQTFYDCRYDCIKKDWIAPAEVIHHLFVIMNVFLFVYNYIVKIQMGFGYCLSREERNASIPLS